MRTLIRLLSSSLARLIEQVWLRREDRTLARASAPIGAVRIRNLNYALLPFAISLLFVVFFTFFASIAVKKHLHLSQGWPYLAGFLALGIFAFAIGCRRILWVDLGPTVTVKHLLSTGQYDRRQIQSWGFEIARGRFTHAPPLADCNFLLLMNDGLRLDVVVSPTKARHIANALVQQIGPA